MGEFEGESTGTPFLVLLRKGWALFAASSDPTGGRRPCPSGDSLTGIDSRAKGFLPPQDKTLSPESKTKTQARLH